MPRKQTACIQGFAGIMVVNASADSHCRYRNQHACYADAGFRRADLNSQLLLLRLVSRPFGITFGQHLCKSAEGHCAYSWGH